MALTTGSPYGLVVTPSELYLDNPPPFFFQKKYTTAGALVGLFNNPDADGFYWQLSGTTANPVYEAGCYESFVFTDVRTVNAIRCDTTGDRGDIQKRDRLNVTFTLKSPFPLAKLAPMLNLGPVTTSGGFLEKAGIGLIDNSVYYYAYWPSVYDPNAGDYVSVTGHRVQFTSAWAWTYAYATPATFTIQATLFADESRPNDQLFATVIRSDASDIT